MLEPVMISCIVPLFARLLVEVISTFNNAFRFLLKCGKRWNVSCCAKRNDHERMLSESASFDVRRRTQNRAIEQNFECRLYNTRSILKSRVFLLLA
jgi:hypothetical protein